MINQDVNLDNLHFNEEHEICESKFENNTDTISFNPGICCNSLQQKDEELGSKNLDSHPNKNFQKQSSDKIIQYKKNIIKGALDNYAPFEKTL